MWTLIDKFSFSFIKNVSLWCNQFLFLLFPAVFTLGTTVRPQGGTFAIIVSSRIRFLDPLHVLDSSLGAAPVCLFVSFCVLTGKIILCYRTCRAAGVLCSLGSGFWDFIRTTCRTRSGTTRNTGSFTW